MQIGGRTDTRSSPGGRTGFVVPPSILIIDDDMMLARGLGRMLAAFTVSIECEPRRAVERIHTNEQFDIIVCDLEMPSMTGYEVLDFIRTHYEGRDDAPNVILTSGSDELLAPGAPTDAAVLLKPFRAAELQALVSCLLAANTERRDRRLASLTAADQDRARYPWVVSVPGWFARPASNTHLHSMTL